MTQADQRTYMSTYLKNQGTWKLTQLKNLTFAEIKEEFKKLVRRIESFVPKDSEIEKIRVKKAGIELQTETSKKQKITVKDVLVTEENVEVVKKEEPIKMTGKRKKQIARKGTHVDKTTQYEAEEDMEAFVKGNVTDFSSGTNIPIIRENGTDKIYISFGAMLKDISRDDLIELYRLVMQKYGTNQPEEEYERVFWGDLKIIVHCLTLESAHIYMLTERRYPIPVDVCQAMLDKKLQGDKKDEACYQLLKLIEKQAQNKLP
ncbi:hypothetical protein Tco_0882466 [Tanacetum coccineum]